jgi:hypothetical protein
MNAIPASGCVVCNLANASARNAEAFVSCTEVAWVHCLESAKKTTDAEACDAAIPFAKVQPATKQVLARSQPTCQTVRKMTIEFPIFRIGACLDQ